MADRDQDQVERLAACIADAFGPTFAAAASRPGQPFKTPIPYGQMPETTKDIFRTVARAVLDRRLDWQSY